MNAFNLSEFINGRPGHTDLLRISFKELVMAIVLIDGEIERLPISIEFMTDKQKEKHARLSENKKLIYNELKRIATGDILSDLVSSYGKDDSYPFIPLTSNMRESMEHWRYVLLTHPRSNSKKGTYISNCTA